MGGGALVFGGGHNPGGPANVVNIGFATATTFARHGARIVVVDRDGAAATRTVDAVRRDGGDAVAVVADVTDPDQVASSHFPFLENPAAFNAVLEDFLARA